MIELHEDIFNSWCDFAINNQIIDEVDAKIEFIRLHDPQELVQLLIIKEPILYQGVHQLAKLATLATVSTRLLRKF